MTVYDVARAMPDLQVLEGRCMALAMLDSILSPEWEFRYYSFDSAWGDGERMASMRDGSGDSWSIVLSEHGAFVRGFDHESVIGSSLAGGLWPGLLDGLPAVFSAAAEEPAFTAGEVLEASACLWRLREDDQWHVGNVELPRGGNPDGADQLFEILLDATPGSYVRFALDYYGQNLEENAVGAILALEPLTDKLVRRLNSEVSLADLAEDVTQIKYPPRLV